MDEHTSLSVDYLGRIHAVLIETGKQVNSIVTMQSLASFVLLAICLDVLSPKPYIALSGLEFAIAAPFVLASGALVTAALLLYQLSLAVREVELRNLVVALYHDIGYEHRTLSETLVSPLEHPGFASAIMALSADISSPRLARKLAYPAARLFIFFVLAGLPVVAQIATIYKLQKMNASQFWLACPLLASAVSLLYLFIFGRLMRPPPPSV